MGKKRLIGLIVLGLGGLLIISGSALLRDTDTDIDTENSKKAELLITPTPVSVPVSVPVSPTPTPTPIPLPDPKVYGPCKNIPAILYHHIQPLEEAMAKNQKNISVTNDSFTNQMAYLAGKGYTTLTPDQLLAGLTGTLPGKPILITFDDGYRDFYTYAYLELVKNNLAATVFIVTGLVGGADYLTWDQIREMAGSGLITFANHTWSHKNLSSADEEKLKYEVRTAQEQLEDRGLGPVTAFAYPYGTQTKASEEVFKELGIKTAFTTIPGSYQCAKLPYAMRRSRIGNSPMSAYGF